MRLSRILKTLDSATLPDAVPALRRKAAE